MQQISELIPQAVEELEQPTNEDSVSSKMSDEQREKLETIFEPFKTLGDQQLVRMKEATIKFTYDLLLAKYSRKAEGQPYTCNPKPYWLSLLGTSGAGKTMLAKLVNQAFRQYKDARIIWFDDDEGRQRSVNGRIVRASGRFILWRKMVQWLREGEYRCFEDVAEDWFVAVDDIGSEHLTEFSLAKLYEMFSRGEDKWRIWTANLSLEQIEQRFDPRIASRMIRGSVVVDVDVPDYNLR